MMVTDGEGDSGDSEGDGSASKHIPVRVLYTKAKVVRG